MDLTYKTSQCKVLDADKGKPIVAQVSTAAVDSDGDVIWQSPSEHGDGWLLDDFNKRGGRVYWMHNPFVPNLASAKAWVDDERLLMAVNFDLEDELAATLDRKIRAGYIDEWSVGFQPVKYEPRAERGLDIYTSRLFEVSVVNQGANPATAVMSKSMADAADLVKLFEDRLRNVEAVLMRQEREKREAAERRLANALEAIKAKNIRAGV